MGAVTAQGPIEPADSPLEMWTIYDHPSDFPDCFVARRFLIYAGGPVATTETISESDLETLRHHFEFTGWSCLQRQDGDDSVIVESWV